MGTVPHPQQPNGDGRLVVRHRPTPAGEPRPMRPMRVKVPRLVEYECGHYDVFPATTADDSTQPPAGPAGEGNCRRCREDAERRRMRRLSELEGASIGRGRAIRGGDSVGEE